MRVNLNTSERTDKALGDVFGNRDPLPPELIWNEPANRIQRVEKRSKASQHAV